MTVTRDDPQRDDPQRDDPQRDDPQRDDPQRDDPLLGLTADVPFARVRPEHVEPGIRALIAGARAALDAIGRDAGAPTYESTLGALERATEPLERAMAVVSHLEAVSTTPALRRAYETVKPEASALYASIPLDARLWSRLRAFAATDEARALDPTRARFLDKTLDEFRRHGAELDEAGKARLHEIDVELSRVTTRFSQNVLDSTHAFELVLTDEERLAGLPASAKEAARQDAASRGQAGYRFTLNAPSLVAVLTFLDDAQIREQVWRAYNTRASAGAHDNRPLIERILRLRWEKARLLGFACFADLVLADRMAKSGARALGFVEELRQRTERFFEREREALAAFRRGLGEEGPLRPWDVGYYAEKLRKALYDFDQEEVRPYFAAHAVLRGLFETAERLYGVRVAPLEGASTWNESVSAYRLTSAGGAALGDFFIDLHPRESKQGGAWMAGLVTGTGDERHVGLFCANVSPPVGDEPALLTHAEVETLFHEFGHLLHLLLTKVPVRSLAGTSVAWDFVELPSQIMENWCWEKEALDLFARHYETGEPIPQALFEKMSRARTYRAATAQMRQLGLAAADLALHVPWDPDAGVDPVARAREVLGPYSVTPLPDDYAMLCSFSHLFAGAVGYAAGYYSYKWAEVLDADAFALFREAGIFDAATGARFRDAILARGDSRDPMELYRDFAGREPRLEPLLERQGLTA